VKLIQDAIRLPVTTSVGVLFLVLFGLIALTRIPVQLTPDVDQPVVTVSTSWPGASPQEIEREIVQEQEEQLKSLQGLRQMQATCSDGNGSITLEFDVGVDLDAATLRVSNRLQQVPSYPDDANKPVIAGVDQDGGASAWFILQKTKGDDGFDGDMSTLFDYTDDVIKPAFERVSGVGASNIFGGRTQEMHVIVDPAALASRRITFNEVAASLERENRNFSGGDFDEGKRRYVVRTVGEYDSPESIENIVVAMRNGLPVYMRDIGHAEMGHRKASARVFLLGEPALAINAIREPGANVLDLVEGLMEVADRLNETVLADRGLRLWPAYNETVYIKSAIGLVQQSLFIGAVLAIIILLLFLRSATSTLVVAVAIPISIIATFLMMWAFGRTLNVISLAGMAFAVGMVVDNSIVVLENIYRHRQMGKPRAEAAFDGVSEVWGAVIASTLTTIAVFIPVMFMKEEAGQLFADIAIAISCAVALSLLIAITVIPSLSAKILGGAKKSSGDDAGPRGVRGLWGGVAAAGRLGGRVTELVYWITGSTLRKIAVVLGMTVLSIGLSLVLMPKTEYLPLGNQNFLFGFMLPPPGYSLDEVSALQDAVEEEISYLWAEEPGSPEAEALPGGGARAYFFVALNNQAFLGMRSNDPLRVRELLPEIRKVNARLPGTIFVVNQSSIFSRGLGEGRSIDIEIAGPDLEQLIALAGQVFGQVFAKVPGAQARPIPGLDLGNPELQVVAHRQRAAELGLSNRDLGFAVSVLVDGAKASEYQLDGKEIDLRLMAEGDYAHRTHLLEQLPIATPSGELIALGSVASISVASGPTTIQRSERQRAIIVRVTPDEQMPLEQAMSLIQDEILQPMRDSGQLGGLYDTRLSGSADKLSETWSALKWNLILALLITYLLMAALFENFVYPFVIMFSVPLAALGGFLGLFVLNTFFTYQALDILTMLGLIILVGTVVNNAILIVHQSLNHMRDDALPHREAIRESVRGRLRPIFMSVSTSVFGMLPLVLFPGAGSELYRGLGTVVVGGLIVSTVFTIFLVPAMLSLMLDARTALEGFLRPGSKFEPKLKD
jgi:HAE1 family hydrophobic/amphiphilic exporter-1